MALKLCTNGEILDAAARILSSIRRIDAIESAEQRRPVRQAATVVMMLGLLRHFRANLVGNLDQLGPGGPHAQLDLCGEYQEPHKHVGFAAVLPVYSERIRKAKEPLPPTEVAP